MAKRQLSGIEEITALGLQSTILTCCDLNPDSMKLMYCLSSVVFFLYFSVVALVLVNGQPTATDEDIEKYEIAQLREELAKVRGELREVVRDSKHKGKLAATTAL